jgi:ABC-type multidrug transport system fused ATPase/permease subunit
VRVLSNVKFSVSPGELVSIVGPSGSGKSTLADLILGIIEPQLGQVQISGLRAEKAIRKWPGAIGYVPQDVSIMSGTIRDNIVMGLSEVEISEKMINDCLGIAQLEEFVSSLPQGINTAVGEQGAKLSGGQKQRLGIARALVTNPQLIIFDEATSALDGVTEAAISKAIQALKGKISIILIAHRLSTVRNSDQIIYISNGEMICKGSFDFVRNEIPDFDTQASLMGL